MRPGDAGLGRPSVQQRGVSPAPTARPSASCGRDARAGDLRGEVCGSTGAGRGPPSAARASARALGRRARPRSDGPTARRGPTRSRRMQVAIISDIHGNRQAFEAVLDDIEASRRGGVWRPRRLRRRPQHACVDSRAPTDSPWRGNHDLAVAGELSLDDFSRGAALAALDAGGHRPGEPRLPRGPPAPRDAGRSTTRPARRGLGVRALGAARRAVPRRGAPRA